MIRTPLRGFVSLGFFLYSDPLSNIAPRRRRLTSGLTALFEREPQLPPAMFSPLRPLGAERQQSTPPL